MKEQVLNEIVKFDSTAEYYQQLEKSILGNQSCYEATVVDGELLGMKVLVAGKHPVGLYLPNATDERQQKAEQMILDYVADPDYFERYMSIGPTANDHFVFMEKVGSGKQMVICGAGHVSIALLRLAKMVGFKVTVIDDRPIFCNKAREAGADEVICEPFRQALERMDDHQEPYFIIVTRGHQYDVDCMHVILGKRHSYIGMMGSKVRVKNLKAGLLEEGYDAALLDSVHMPIGLKIGAMTPEEIAVSIIAEVIECRRTQKEKYCYSSEMQQMLSQPEEGVRMALATIIVKKGCGPREAGTKMIILEDGRIIGTIGGGCAEAEVISKARYCIRENICLMEHVDMTGREAAENGLVCGGVMDILIQPLS